MELSNDFYRQVIDEVYFEIVRLRNTRIKLGISQQKMAQYMGITTQKLIRIEKGYSRVFAEDYIAYQKIIATLVQDGIDSHFQK